MVCKSSSNRKCEVFFLYQLLQLSGMIHFSQEEGGEETTQVIQLYCSTQNKKRAFCVWDTQRIVINIGVFFFSFNQLNSSNCEHMCVFCFVDISYLENVICIPAAV